MKITAELKSEGITLELLKKMQSFKQNLPAILESGCEPTTFIKSPKGYWGFDENQNLLKNPANNMPMDYAEIDVLAGKVRFYLLNREEMIDKATEKEFAKVKDELKKQATGIIEKFDSVYYKAYEKYFFKQNTGCDPFIAIAKQINLERYAFDKESAANLLEKAPIYQKEAERLTALLEIEDYDSLYIYLKEPSALIMSAKIDNPEQMKVLKDNFSASKISDTIEMLKEKGHLWTVCRMKVSKDFF